MLIWLYRASKVDQGIPTPQSPRFLRLFGAKIDAHSVSYPWYYLGVLGVLGGAVRETPHTLSEDLPESSGNDLFDIRMTTTTCLLRMLHSEDLLIDMAHTGRHIQVDPSMIHGNYIQLQQFLKGSWVLSRSFPISAQRSKNN